MGSPGVGHGPKASDDRRRLPGLVLLVATLLVLGVAPAMAQRDTTSAVVRGVLFFSPTCGHCEAVINDHLPGIYEANGGQATLSHGDPGKEGEVAHYLMSNGRIELLLVDVSTEAGAQSFRLDTERLGLSRAGVPRLDIGERHLVGSVDIPEQLPTIVREGLAAGGLDWPAVPGIAEALASIPGRAVARGPDAAGPDEAAQAGGQGAGTAVAARPEVDSASVWERVGRDPLGNGLAIVVLVFLVASLILVPALVLRGRLTAAPSALVIGLAAVGIAVSAYLGSVETRGTEAVCGPVGDCNAVQQSEYATLFGIPIGVIGLVAYTTILVAWVVARVSEGRRSASATLLVAAIALGGTVFSIYLTFLEPFVIGATCAWCLTSALAIGGLLWATAPSGWLALQRLRDPTGSQPWPSMDPRGADRPLDGRAG
jgi:uncharacterized membrane protein